MSVPYDIRNYIQEYMREGNAGRSAIGLDLEIDHLIMQLKDIGIDARSILADVLAKAIEAERLPSSLGAKIYRILQLYTWNMQRSGDTIIIYSSKDNIAYDNGIFDISKIRALGVNVRSTDHSDEIATSMQFDNNEISTDIFDDIFQYAKRQYADRVDGLSSFDNPALGESQYTMFSMDPSLV